MIYLWSASPGTGKTCYVVKQLIEKWTVDEKYKDRKIYHNINGLKIEGLHKIPDDFRECENGSILIYDEAQDIEYYSVESKINPVAKELSKHRHRGFDIHFITQDPALLNKWVLKNVYMHYYLWRPAQASNVTIYTFPRAIVAPTKADFKSAYDKRLWRFEKYYLQFYQSTVLNTSEKLSSTKKSSILITGFLFACLIAYFIRPIFSIADGFGATSANASTSEQDTDVQNQESTAAQPDVQSDNLDEVNLQNRINYYQAQEQQRQQELYQRKLELYNEYLDKDYEVIKSDEALQVRGVIKIGNTCKAYNTHGDLMTLTQSQCNYYIAQSGRVHKSNQSSYHSNDNQSSYQSFAVQDEPSAAARTQQQNGG